MRLEYYDFIELFEKNIMADYISSDLVYWNCDIESRESAIELMWEKNYDLLVIKKANKVLRKVITKENEIKEITPEQVIPKSTPITKLINKLIDEKYHYYFIEQDGQIKDIITLADLQKGPSRLLLFGLIMNFEIVCIDFILKFCPDWQFSLEEKILKKIIERFNCLRKFNLDITPLHCSFIDDKINILKNSDKFKDLCESCKEKEHTIRFYLKRLIKLRNNLAHSNHIKAGFKNWENLLKTIKTCLLLTEKMMEYNLEI
ncbi:MAG: hypothetical protein ACTSRP_19295 [Candidatus Helarchaeota archaeon]